MSNGIKDLFGKSNNILPKTSIKNVAGSDSPIESSEYIQQYIEQKKRFLPTVDFSTASNFAVYGSAEQYAHDTIKSIYNTYPYDGSATEKIEWLNKANYYDLYLFEFLYPRTCGYAVFSPDGWGSQAATVADAGLGAAFVYGLSSNPEYIQLKAGPHPDPEATSKTLAKQFPEPWDGTANVWDNTSGIDRVANIVLDPASGITTEFWFKKSGYVSSSATSRFEYIFDVWNGQTGTAEGSSYGRYSILHDGTSSGAIKIGMMSGSQLMTCDSGLTTSEVFDNKWHHIAITFQSGSSPNWFELNTYLDGQHHTTKTAPDQANVVLGEITGSLIANIGAARIPSITQAGSNALSSGQKIDGYAKLSGSIDEFRFWKTARTPKEISRFWFTQIAGGTNTDNNKFSGSAAPVDLGFYYKFNEGNTGDATTDATVLDYSGRISNGAWTGFIADKSRVAGPVSSAMIESSASATEFKDPIIYSSHPEVMALSSSLIQKGQEWDIQNNAALYHTLPEWITSDDREMQGETLKKLMQVLGTYYDTLQMQIRNLPTIVDKAYPTTDFLHHSPDANAAGVSYIPGETSTGKTRLERFFNKPSPYSQNAVEDYGMIAPEIFAGVEALAQLASRDEVREFEKKLYDVKNLIYQSIYNNLTYIYKSKGTEKSFRNLIHCYGVDDDLVRLNLYADNATFKFDDASYHSKTLKRKYIDFATTDRKQSTIYQSASVIISSDTLSYLPTQDSRSMTFEADIIFPYKHPRSSDHWYEFNYTTSSLFGCHEANASAPNDFTWHSNDSASFQVHAIRQDLDSPHVSFMLTSSNGFFPTLTSPVFHDVYDHTRWTFAVRLQPESTYRNIPGVLGVSSSAPASWKLSLYGVNVASDEVQNSFHVSGSLGLTDAVDNFLNLPKRVYAGAHRTNFSGSNVVNHTDIKLGSVSVWDDCLSDEEIIMHAVDPNNMGRKNFYESSYLLDHKFDPNVDSVYIPRVQTQLLNWQFGNVTGSSPGVIYVDHYGGSAWNSSFEITDMSSGSLPTWAHDTDYGRYQTHMGARGDWFLPNDTGSVSLEMVHVANQNLPEVMSGDDTIQILATDDRYFTRDTTPVNYYFAIEKSMAQTVSKEVLDLMGSVSAFNNLIGEPINRYRQDYKSLEKVREMFFRRVGNELDFNRFIDFYKWIDNSLSEMLMELVPASVDIADGIKNVIESHILERSKYWTKFPTLEMKDEPIVGYVKGIKELTYNWKYGHAPQKLPLDNFSGIAFNGTNTQSQLTVGDANSLSFGADGTTGNEPSFSFSAWINVTGMTNQFTIITKAKYDGTDREYIFFIHTDRVLKLFVHDADSSNYIAQVADTALSTGKWHHVCATYDGSRAASGIKLYVNGALWASSASSAGSYTAMHNGSQNVAIGRLFSDVSTAVSEGFIDELAVFDKALSLSEIEGIYNDRHAYDFNDTPLIQNMVSWWRMGDTTIGTAPNYAIPDQMGSNGAIMTSFQGTANSGVVNLGSTNVSRDEAAVADNCLWWRERAEASALSSGDTEVDTGRNTIRRVVTSDVTTNKILATGEYTDPTDYPNSGLPNAAQVRLAQSGSSSTTRQEYKGSTFALRRFSKPYKMEIDEVAEIHGGINYPTNKRRSLSKANIARADHAVFYNTPAQTDDLLDCDDVVNPSVKKFHSYAYNINNGLSGGDRKGSHHAPFNLVSSSVTTNASLVETGIDIVNLHTDAYGDMNEVPMQGPFTERHVGGMAHRHQDISDTSDTDTSRTENFRFLVVKDTHAILKPGNTNNASTAENYNNPFDRFYRDGLAKRPVNIKNIKTTSGSQAHGNYYKIHQLAHTQTKNTAPWFVKLEAATGSAGLKNLISGKASFYGASDTPNRPKLRYFAHTLADTENLGAPFSEAQVEQLHSPHTMIERFSAPGGPDTAGDSGGGFGLDWVTSQYSPNNALPWRNRAVREPLHAMLSRHSGLYGSFSGSALSATETTTAVSASYHKVNRNVDYDIRQDTTTQSYASKSLLFDGNNDYYESDNINRRLKKWTVSTWIRPTSTGTSTIFHMETATFTSKALWCYWSSGYLVVGAEFSLDGYTATTNYFITPTNTAIVADQWTHLVLVWDQDGSDTQAPPRLYLNGVSTPMIYSSGGAPSTAKPAWHWEDMKKIVIGDSSNSLTGYMQDISLWNTALTTDQVKEIYHLPNYDAAGPGDLTTLRYVTNKEISNSLVGWWKLGTNTAASTLDFAPIDTCEPFLQSNGTYQAAVESTVVMPANYYGTTCVATYDNWYVQHPIPANDYGYAWITASADKDTGCELVTTASFITASDFGSYDFNGAGQFFGIPKGEIGATRTQHTPVDFVGLNTIIVEPTSGSENYLGYDLAYGVVADKDDAAPWGDSHYFNRDYLVQINENEDGTRPGGVVGLNSILLHRNGPYGHPSWKQLRAGEHPIARNHKKNNILSVGDAPSSTTFMHGGSLLKSTELHGSSFTNYTEPLVSKKYKPITHRLDSVKANGAQTLQPLTLKHSYANNLSMFANVDITNKLGVSKEDRQKYHYIRDTYLNSDMAPAENPTKAFKSLVYAETIYPKEVNTFLSGARGRSAWAETNAEISSSVHGEGRTFWRDTLENRMRDEGALNCMGYRIYSNPNKGANLGANNDRNPWFLPSGALSIWPLDTGERGTEAMDGGGQTVPSNVGHAYPNLAPPTGDEWGGHVGELYQDPIGSLYASLDYKTLVDEVAMSSAAGHVGSTTFTFGGGSPVPADEAKLAVTDYYGTTVTFEAQDDEDDVTPGNAWVDTNGVSTAAAMDDKFKAAFDAHASHLVMSCLVGGTGQITLYQLQRGHAGNTTVTANTAWNNACSVNPTNFANGASMNHFMAKSSSVGYPSSNSNRYYAMPGTASICFNHFCVAGTTLDYALAGTNMNRRINEPNHIMDWYTPTFAGRNPWFDSYEDYASDIRSMAQDYTVLPEFRISEHMDHYVTNGFSAKNYKFLSLEGADNSSSADAYSDTYNEQFWKEYCHSDFLKYFGGVQEDHSELAPVSAISFKCSVVKKLLPYNGFYPVQRSVQLASLFSSSYGPYITGSSKAHYGGSSAEEHPAGKYFAERMQSLLQPFYAPGIMYNTLKSCVAVDYPIHTGSGATVADARGQWKTGPRLNIEDSGSRRYMVDDPNFRMPFEAIVMPHEYLPVSQSGNTDADNTDANQGKLWLTAPYYGSASFFAGWTGQQKPQYSMAAHNFFAEVPNFFLEAKTFNSFTSAKESAFKPMAADTTYYMDVVLFKTNDYVSHEGFWYDTRTNNDDYYATRGWGYGPPYNTYNTTYGSAPQAVNDPSWAPHAPPYFYGRSVARIKFTPNEHFDMGTCESQVFTLDEILAGAELETEFLCEVGTGLPAAFKASAERLNTSPNSTASKNKMAVTSSVSLFGKTQKPAIEFDAVTGEPLTAVENPQAGMGAWVIGTKFECPSLNFYGIYGGAADVDGTLPTLPSDPSELSFTSGSLQHRVRGLFNGYGEQPKDGAGIFLGLRESFSPDAYDIKCENGVGSLIDVCGFKPERKRLGRVAENKIISEAIVAIPFVDVGGERKFFALGDTPMQSRALYQSAVAGNEGPGTSIRIMANRMSRYVLPPHLDFKTDSTIEPFAMYIFEFTHKLSRDDLSDIWQGIMPDISVTAEKSQTAITHETAVNEFFRGNPIPKHTRWMVFKVKRRAKESYFDVTADASDDTRYTFTYQDQMLGRPDYTYNWPYDFFSLIELAKIDVKAGIGDTAIPLLPMSIFPMDLTPGSIEMASVMKAGALANKAAMLGADAQQAQAAVDKAATDNMGTADASKWLGTFGSFGNRGSGNKPLPPGLMVDKAVELADPSWIGGFAGGPVADAAKLLDNTSKGSAKSLMGKAGTDMAGKFGTKNTPGQGGTDF